MSSREVINCVWNSTNRTHGDLHELCTSSVESVIRASFVRKSMDNVTVLMIAFDRFNDCNFGAESALRGDKENVNSINLTRNNELLQKFKKLTLRDTNKQKPDSSSRRLRKGFFN